MLGMGTQRVMPITLGTKQLMIAQ
ncbi:hypothetical protein J0S82_012739 [Galemys pyrenaicus]|uniref:Uncharacterized protein n=1 Tax=Galemys pyrenaicus TaxID=202257 RepID=A0A8J6AK67_GALPY|nr:hypothetical protein J0S82_012739 [Galemys pyrenaicus]